MARKLSAFSARVTAATPASLATAFGGGTTAAEMTALKELFDVLQTRKDLLLPALKLCTLATQIQLQPE
jgi:hypothetical protein